MAYCLGTSISFAVMRFMDEAHLHTHHAHPAHVAVVTELDRLCQQSIDFDLHETAQ